MTGWAKATEAQQKEQVFRVQNLVVNVGCSPDDHVAEMIQGAACPLVWPQDCNKLHCPLSPLDCCTVYCLSACPLLHLVRRWQK